MRDAGNRGKQAAVAAEYRFSHTFARYAKRVVCAHEPDEDEPKPPKAKPIVSINGEDVEAKDKRAA